MSSSTDETNTLNERKTVLPLAELHSGGDVTLKSTERARLEEIDELGRGGMGEVVMAHDHDISRTVAVKRLERDANPQLVYRFLEEVRTLGQLEHPNIVPLYDVGLDSKGRYFFVMKKLDGQTLDRVIDDLATGNELAHQRFPFTVRIQICMGILNALMHAHRHGIIHRDLKPQNIIVGADGEVTVLDWGIAKRVGASEPAPAPNTSASSGNLQAYRTELDVVIGTPQYMSPEQARADDLDARSDLYSVAVLFHELLYLEHYLAKTKSKTKLALLKNVAEVMPSVHIMKRHPTQPMVPMELSWFLHKGFQKDRNLRFQSAEEMQAALLKLIDGCYDAQCPRTAIKRVMRASMPWVDEHPILAVTSVVFGSVFMVAGIVSMVRMLM